MDPEKTNENEKENDGVSSISSDLIRGHINTIILRTLYDGDKYGYEIINEIEEKSKGQYSLKQPTLYSALKRLESQDYVTSYWGGATSGGRRKYFQITDKGRTVVEQNLAEWEYSRTVIDSLISEKDYDFNNPPPAPSVDFNLLKKSTSRVPIMRSDEEEGIRLGEAEEEQEGQADDVRADSAEHEADAQDAQPVEVVTEQTQEAPAPQAAQETAGQAPSRSIEERTETFSAAEQTVSTSQTIYEQQARTESEEQVISTQAAPLSPEEKARIHENYKALIGDETDATAYYYSQMSRKSREQKPNYDKEVFNEETQQQPEYAQEQAYAYAPQDAQYAQQNGYAQPQQGYGQEFAPQYGNYAAPEYAEQQEEDAAELLYANKSPAERNYKSLLNRLYKNTQPAEEEYEPEQPPREEYAAEQDPAPEPQPQPEPAPAPAQRPVRVQGKTASNIEFYDVEEKAENDGLRVTTTNGSRNRTIAKAVGNTFDKGKALFFSAVCIFVIAMAEAIANLCLRGVLKTSAAYVVIPFVINFVMLGVFLFLFLRGYGKNSRKSQTKSYISSSLILFVNLVLVICLIAYLVLFFGEYEITFVEILVFAILPCVYVLNIPLFAIAYNYYCNKM